MKRGFKHVTIEALHYEKDGMLPKRADDRSAGYDFYSPIDVLFKPNQTVIIWTNIKAYMLRDEVLNLYVRSSIATKKGLKLVNQVGVIDSSYYGNEDNDGNIGIALCNTSDRMVVIQEGERIVQGIFVKYLTADNDSVIHKHRSGGFGSSNEKEDVING
ncbi:MAG: dUTPase [Clostridia bacterium]|jgi:dUTP pyrophosphatase|nr:dUTPase [Clostridia bacterium]